MARSQQAKRKNKLGAKSNVQTPQPKKNAPKVKTPKSAPPPKRKKLEDELSDEDFEQMLKGVSQKEKEKIEKGLKTPKKESEDEDDVDMSGDEEDSDLDDDSLEETPKPAAKKSKPQKAATNGSAVIDKKALQTELKASAERDLRTLFVRPLPNNVTEEKMQEVCKDVIGVRLRHGKSGKFKRGAKCYGFVEFKSEKIAEKSIPELLGKEIDGVKILIVDFVGAKSKNKKPVDKKETVAEVDPLRLYISGFGHEINVEKLSQLFPDADVTVPMKKSKKKPLGFAFAQYTDEKACQKAHDATQNVELEGRTLTVLFAKKRTEPVTSPQKRPGDEDKKKRAKEKEG